jgi:hypothetical protein
MFSETMVQRAELRPLDQLTGDSNNPIAKRGRG